MEKTLLIVGLMIVLGANLYLNNTQEVSYEIDTANLYANWKMKYHKRYTNQRDEMYRYKVFTDNLNYIRAFQESPQDTTYTLELNQFADMSQQEFAQTYLTLKVPEVINSNANNDNFQYQGEEVDWTTDKSIKYPAVKNQGECGSSWAFSAVGVVEINLDIQFNLRYNLSEQDLIDCSRSYYGNNGCNGGLIISAFNYISDNNLALAKDYPYIAKDGVCKTSVLRPQSYVHGFQIIDSCDQLAEAIKVRTISVSVDAINWQFYKSGILSQCAKNLNHGVVLVGIAADGTWKLRNSWGTNWGEDGHIRLAKGDTCGICGSSYYPRIFSLVINLTQMQLYNNYFIYLQCEKHIIIFNLKKGFLKPFMKFDFQLQLEHLQNNRLSIFSRLAQTFDYFNLTVLFLIKINLFVLFYF